MSWNAVLETYARMKSPEKELPAGVHLLTDDHTLTIFDGYEKAKYHFLVMPRDPFQLASGKGTVTSSHLHSLSALLKSPNALEVLRALKTTSEKVRAMVEDEMVKNEGWTWSINIGFHAVESMRHVHLHVISGDLLSPKLKNKKHYNSFHPKLGFFLHLDDVLEQVEAGKASSVLKSTSSYEALLKLPLESIYTQQEFSTIPKLKAHFQLEWEKAGKNAKKASAAAAPALGREGSAAGARKRKSEEEDREDAVDVRESSMEKKKKAGV